MGKPVSAFPPVKLLKCLAYLAIAAIIAAVCLCFAAGTLYGLWAAVLMVVTLAPVAVIAGVLLFAAVAVIGGALTSWAGLGAAIAWEAAVRANS